MKAGILQHRVELQEQGGGTNDWGEPIPGDWITIARLWANIHHLSGSESIKAGADTSVVKASIRIRRNPAATAGCRILHEGKTYDIEAVLPDCRRIITDLICKQIT